MINSKFKHLVGRIACWGHFLKKLSKQLPSFNYKSLDEHSTLGLIDTPKPPFTHISPAQKSALKLYTLLHNIKSLETQLPLHKYFKVLQFSI